MSRDWPLNLEREAMDGAYTELRVNIFKALFFGW